MQMKTCSKCKKNLEITEFWKDKEAKDGLRSYCKGCGWVYNDQKPKPDLQKRRYYYNNRKERYKTDPIYREKAILARREYMEKYVEKTMYIQARYRARKNKLAFNITLDDVIVPKYCPILGLEINRGGGRRKGRNGPSLDRIDPSKGYIKGNVAVISDLANVMKNNATFEELRRFSKHILSYIGDEIVQPLE